MCFTDSTPADTVGTFETALGWDGDIPFLCRIGLPEICLCTIHLHSRIQDYVVEDNLHIHRSLRCTNTKIDSRWLLWQRLSAPKNYGKSGHCRWAWLGSTMFMDKFGSVVAGHIQGCWDVVGQIHSAVCNYDQISVMKKQFAGFQTTSNWWEFRFPKNHDGIVIFNGKWVFPRHVASKHWLPDMSKFSLPDLELGGFVQELGTKWVKRMALIRSVPQPSKSIEKPLSDPIPEWKIFFGCYWPCTKSRNSWNGNVEIYWVLYPASHSQL